MALAAIVASLEGLAEGIRGEYKKIEKGDHAGKFMLDVTPTENFALEDVKGLKASVSAARKERDDWKRKVLDLGIDEDADVGELKKSLERVKEIKDWTPESKVQEQIESVKAQLATKHGSEKKALQDQLAALEAEVNSLLVDAVASKAIADAGGSPALLLPHVKSAAKVVRENGKASARIMENGTARLSMKQGKDEPMSIEEYVEILKSDNQFAPAFSGTNAKGVGTRQPGKGQQQQNQNQQQGSQSQGDGGNGGNGNGNGQGSSMVEQLREKRRQEWDESSKTFAGA